MPSWKLHLAGFYLILSAVREATAEQTLRTGLMTIQTKNFLSQAPWMAVWPGLASPSLVLSFNLLDDGLHDALDPRLRLSRHSLCR